MSNSLRPRTRRVYASVPTTTAIDTLPNLIAAKTIPDDWQNGANAAKSPYGGPVTVGGTVGAAKRPDFIVGVPTVGPLAFDVKAKTPHDNAILIDELEHR